MASHSQVFELLIIKILNIYIYIYILMLRFFVWVAFFLLERDRKCKNYECDGLGNLSSYKMMFVSAS